MFLSLVNQHRKSYAVRISLREKDRCVTLWGSQPLMCAWWPLTYPREAPWGPQPQTWFYAERWRPLCRQLNDGHMSEPHTSWAWPQPDKTQRQTLWGRENTWKHLLIDRTDWNNKLITNLSTNSHWPVKNTMHAQNGWLWRVDDGCAKEWAENAAITDGECTTIHIFHCQLVLACLRVNIYTVNK